MRAMSGWYAIMDAAELTRGKPLARRVLGTDYVFWRTAEGQPVCMPDRCPHRRAKLSLGSISGQTIVCPYHGIAFTAGGQCAFVPELNRSAPGMRIPSLPVVEYQGFIWLRFEGEGSSAAVQPPWFDEITQAFRYVQQSAEWPVSYQRWIENELDVTHLPFVHRTTIGRRRDPRSASRFETDDEGVRIFFDSETNPNRVLSSINFRFPNLWRLSVSDHLFLLMVFVPVEAARTRVYVRSYHDFFTWYPARSLVSVAMRWLNARILAEDHRVVCSQPPPLKQGAEPDVLLKQDTGIQHYRDVLARATQGAPAPQHCQENHDSNCRHVGN